MLLATVLACSDYDLKRDADATGDTGLGEEGGDGGGEPWEGESTCELTTPDDRDVGVNDTCSYEIGGFTPVATWSGGSSKYSRSTPSVADIDGDGLPEILVNITGIFSDGELLVTHGDGSGTLWETSGASLGYATGTAVADVDGDGSPEIFAVREYAGSLFGDGDYTAVAYDAEGNEIWESDHFVGDDFDYGTHPIVSDMEHDGEPEVVVGRVILDANTGATRGFGPYGRGNWVDYGTLSEGTLPAVADLDLDGEEEVVVGNARYAVDGAVLDAVPSESDGVVAVANLDSDPEGEIIVTNSWSVWAKDTDFSELWSLTIQTANIVSPPAVGDLDNDGWPEIVVAGGNEIYALNHDGSVLWQEAVHDSTGLSGASLFDFDADGIMEVVYIDERQLIAFQGDDGTVRFQTNDHASDTMGEYPAIADVDGDGHAEIVVPHAGMTNAFTVYEDATDSWAPTNGVWNQHAYSIDNIEPDLTVPTYADPNFTTHNSWHAAESLVDNVGAESDLEAEITDLCEDCETGTVALLGRLLNKSAVAVPAGVPISLYAQTDDGLVWLAATETTVETASGRSGEPLEFVVSMDDVGDAHALVLSVDDDGSGGETLVECSESNNTFSYNGPFCEDG